MYNSSLSPMFPSKILCEVASQPFKRAQTGLFHGKTKLYGNNVPFSKQKTRRTWLPNVQHKRLRSEILDEEIRVKLTTRALRTIHKKGGLDNYLKTTSGEMLGDKGMELRMKVRAREAELKAQPSQETGITTLASAIANFGVPKRERIGPKYNEWTARSARLLVGWRLGKQIATASETINFYKRAEKLTGPVTKVSAIKASQSKPKLTSKHAPFMPSPLWQKVSPPKYVPLHKPTSRTARRPAKTNAIAVV